MLPALIATRGTVLNILSTAAWVSLPMLPGYSASKAAAFSLTQGLRAHLARDGVRVRAAMIGAVDTDMTRDLPGSRPPAGAVAGRILDALAGSDDDEIFPDPASGGFAGAWRASPFKAFENAITNRRRDHDER